MPADTQRLFAEAARLRQAGNLAGAELLYRRILAADPRHGDSLQALGLLQYLRGDVDGAIGLIRQAIAVDDAIADYHSNLGLMLGARGFADEAIASFRAALRLEPGLAESWNNLGNVLADQDWLEDAAEAYRKALALQPRAPAISVNLGNALRRKGDLDGAVTAYRQALALTPGDGEARKSLGATLRQQGRLVGAQQEYRHALGHDPRDQDALNALSSLARAQGDHDGALKAIRRAWAIADTAETRRLFAAVLQELPPADYDAELRLLLARALDEAWDWPDKLAGRAAELVRAQVGATPDLPALANDPLLLALLTACPNCDLALEDMLARARRQLLDALPGKGLLAFAAALARQCFINEYVFSADAEEREHAEALRQSLDAALAQGTVPSPGMVAVVAAYFPLGVCAQARHLLEHAWPEAVEAVLTQQVREPQEEGRLRDATRQITPVADAVSQRVRAQYEEHPYPRWVRIGAGDPVPVQAGNERNILVAGCGTGQYLVALAQQSPGARILATDLSLASLAYAQRKVQEAGLTGIHFAQADILEMGALEQRFDIIECGGVLHMLDDPLRGWCSLLALLKPGGTMRLALYSALGRRNIAAAKAFIDRPSGAFSADDIRHARRQLIAARNTDFRDVTESSDFFSLSGCRNLLFLAQERRMTLEEIAAFLHAQSLVFLGFSTDDRVQAHYRQRFAQNPDPVDLGQWQLFEQENPDTFLNMYQFWVRKEA